MDILQRFERYVQENKLFTKEDKILVAVSGGRDSMLLAWLLYQCHFSIELAHCNFQLRGEESEMDEQLVRHFAEENELPLHVIRFDTTDYAERNKVSIQIAARELRYEWFGKLSEERGCVAIAVAHHLNDSVETVLFNLSRGTGLLGLQGILPKREDSKIVRPLLFLKREEITDLVEHYRIPFRDDQSNFSNKYARNRIRLDIIPEFEKLNPDFVEVMADNICRFRDSLEVLQLYAERLRRELLIPRGAEAYLIEKQKIRSITLNELYFVLEPFGFKKNILSDLLHSLGREPGKTFTSETHIIVTDREYIILSRQKEALAPVLLTSAQTFIRWGSFTFQCEVTKDKTIVKDKHIALLDFEKLTFPLTIRSWQEGDSFQPLGMKGTKKLSDFFIQKKVNVLDKERVPVIVDGNGDIIWVAPFQLDDRFKIEDNTQKVFKLVCNFAEQ